MNLRFRSCSNSAPRVRSSRWNYSAECTYSFGHISLFQVRALINATRSPTVSILPISEVENLTLNALSTVSISRMWARLSHPSTSLADKAGVAVIESSSKKSAKDFR